MNRPLHRLAALALPLALVAAACGSDETSNESFNTEPPPETAAPPETEQTEPEPDTEATDSKDAEDGAAEAEPAGAFPATIETCGREITFDAAPTSVVVGWPTTITTLNALGVGDSVIGYTSSDFADAPDTDATAIAPDFRTSREVMINTGLDAFIVNDENQVDASDGNLGWDDLEGLDAGGYVLGGYCLDAPAPTDIDVVFDDITALGTMFGVPDAASELSGELRARLDEAAAGLSDVAGSSVAVVQAFEGTLYALSGSYYAMVASELGLESVFDIDANFAEISPEEVLVLAPETIVVVYEGDDTQAEAAVDEVTSLLASSPAVAENRIGTVQNAQLSGGGVGVVDAIVDVADQFAS